MGILFRIVHFHILHLFQELRRKVLYVIKIGSMDMKYVRMRGDLHLHTVNFHQFVSVLDKPLINPVIAIRGVHHYNDTVLYS